MQCEFLRFSTAKKVIKEFWLDYTGINKYAATVEKSLDLIHQRADLDRNTSHRWQAFVETERLPREK